MLLQDVRYGLRTMRQNAGFTAIAILVTAMGIGANSAIFSVINAVLLRPLPYDHAEQLVRFQTPNTKTGRVGTNFSYLNFADLRAGSESFEVITAFTDTGAAVTGGEAPERVVGVQASRDFFNVLGATPLLGRTFTAEDEQPGTDVVVINHGFWIRRFGSNPQVIGEKITLNGKTRTIVGVLPAEFHFVFLNEIPDYFVSLDPKGDMEVQRGVSYLEVIGKLKTGATIDQASDEMRAVAARLEQQYPDDNSGDTVLLVSAHDDLVGEVLRRMLLVLLGAVGFVLLIACANVANLQLARAAARRREFAVRFALGASRARVMVQLITENLLLALFGGALGLLVAVWGLDLISALVPADLPRFKEVSLDGAVLAFTVTASMLTGVVFGLAPALQASRIDLNEALKEGGRSATDGRRRHRVRSTLIVSEVALSLILLAGAGLLIKSFQRLRTTSLGFRAENVLTASIQLPPSRYPEDEQIAGFYQRLMDRVKTLPGVESAGAILPLPLADSSISTNFTIEGEPAPDPGASPNSAARIVTPGYLETMGVPLLEGRVFSQRDDAAAQKVILVNQSLAERYFPGGSAVGRRLNLGLNEIRGEIVGVVGDVRHRKVEKDPGPEYYVPLAQVPINSVSIVLRGNLDEGIAAGLRAVVQELDKDLPVFQLRPMQSLVSDAIARQRFSTTLLGAFAALALVLAAAGLFSVMSFLVAQRTHEIGVRMALGAQRRDVLRLILGKGMALAGAGIAIGLAGGLLLTRLMEGLLFGVSSSDPATFAAISLTLVGVAALACYLPARRASRVDPMLSLRCE